MHGAAQASLDITSREAWGAMNFCVADNGDRIAVVASECYLFPSGPALIRLARISSSLSRIEPLPVLSPNIPFQGKVLIFRGGIRVYS